MQRWLSTGLRGRICPPSPHPSALLPAVPQPGPPPSLGWHRPASPAAEPSPARESGSHGEAEGLPTSGFSHSFPVTSSPAPTSAVHRRCSLGSRPRGLRLGGNSIQMELFFHIFGGEGRKVWEKAARTRKTEGRSRFAKGLVSTAPSLRGDPGNRGGSVGKLRHGAPQPGHCPA